MSIWSYCTSNTNMSPCFTLERALFSNQLLTQHWDDFYTIFPQTFPEGLEVKFINICWQKAHSYYHVSGFFIYKQLRGSKGLFHSSFSPHRRFLGLWADRKCRGIYLSFIEMLFCLHQRQSHLSKNAVEILQFGRNNFQVKLQFLITENQVASMILHEKKLTHFLLSSFTISRIFCCSLALTFHLLKQSIFNMPKNNLTSVHFIACARLKEKVQSSSLLSKHSYKPSVSSDGSGEILLDTLKY